MQLNVTLPAKKSTIIRLLTNPYLAGVYMYTFKTPG